MGWIYLTIEPYLDSMFLLCTLQPRKNPVQIHQIVTGAKMIEFKTRLHRIGLQTP